MKRNKISVILMFIFFCLVFNGTTHYNNIETINSGHSYYNQEKDDIKEILSSRNVSGEKLQRLTNLYYMVPDSIRSEIIDIHYVESRYDSLAISPTGDYGLGQINLRTWREPIDSLLCADYNIRSTVDKYTRALKTAHNNKYIALYIYNGSISYLKKYSVLWNEEIDLVQIKELRFKKNKEMMRHI